MLLSKVVSRRLGAMRTLALARRSYAATAAEGTAAAPRSLLDVTVQSNGVAVVAFNDPKRLNAWTMPLLLQLRTTMKDLADRRDIVGVVVTGTGAYYSAGVDLSAMIQPMPPAKLVTTIRDANQSVFELFLCFPKPIISAMNGPAIGAAVTTGGLTDGVVAVPSTTLSTPFASLGVPPEGCSSVTYPERLGEATAQRILGPEAWKPTAQEALDIGLIEAVAPPDQLLSRATEMVLARNGVRRYDASEVLRLRKVNARESATLANAFVSRPFLDAMVAFNTKRNKPKLTIAFKLLRATLPLWRPPPIEPNHID